MAATNDAKQKKGSLMSLYKAATASPRHHFQPPEPSPEHRHRNQADIKSYISRGWLFRRSKLARSNTSSREHSHVLGDAENVAGGVREDDDVGEVAERVVVEGRKSVSHVESSLGSVVSFLQVKVLACDMPSYMQVHAFRCARRTHDSLEKFSARHMAYNIKKEFDKVHGPAWHCIVGSSFGSFVTHSTGCFLYFSMDKLYILLFKTKIQKAPHS